MSKARIPKLTGYVKRGQYITADKVPFQQMLPLKLRQFVSGKSEKSTTAACVQEMSVMFSCLKTNDFNESACSQEVAAFQKCYVNESEGKRLKKIQERKGILRPGEKNLSHKQVSNLLKAYPG